MAPGSNPGARIAGRGVSGNSTDSLPGVPVVECGRPDKKSINKKVLNSAKKFIVRLKDVFLSIDWLYYIRLSWRFSSNVFGNARSANPGLVSGPEQKSGPFDKSAGSSWVNEGGAPPQPVTRWGPAVEVPGEVRRVVINDRKMVLLIVDDEYFTPGDLLEYDPTSDKIFRCKRLSYAVDNKSSTK